MRHRLLLVTLTLLVLAGCGDKRIVLNYVPDAAAAKPEENAPAVTVFAFRDARGDEGDENPYRVGGVYGGYGNRLSKVLADKPVMPTLVDALAAGFRARGVPARSCRTASFGPAILRSLDTRWAATSGTSPPRLASRTPPTSARSFGSMRPTARSLRRRRSPTVSGPKYGGGGVLTSIDDLQRLMNEALAQFVQRVVTDPDITARLKETPR